MFHSDKGNDKILKDFLPTTTSRWFPLLELRLIDRPHRHQVRFPNDITPFYARELSNSYGWTLMFQVRGVDMI